MTATARIPSPVPPSATLAINERIEQKLRDGEDVLHLAFGEAGLPLLPSVAERLANAAPKTSYGSVAGSAEAREAAAGWCERRGLPTKPEQILFAPGSKPLLYALLTVLPGGTKAAAHLHVCRTVCRRAEREAIRVEDSNPEVVRYLNRLSDLLFILSRGANAGEEPLWEPGRYR
jgi:histidinol-phosphate/aromatic aminotransferase/cobyric acid decarboxylase-like protein